MHNLLKILEIFSHKTIRIVRSSCTQFSDAVFENTVNVMLLDVSFNIFQIETATLLTRRHFCNGLADSWKGRNERRRVTRIDSPSISDTSQRGPWPEHARSPAQTDFCDSCSPLRFPLRDRRKAYSFIDDYIHMHAPTHHLVQYR